MRARDDRVVISRWKRARGQPATTNMAFGGDDWKTLYFTTRSHLFSVDVNVAGIPVPVTAKKK